MLGHEPLGDRPGGARTSPPGRTSIWRSPISRRNGHSSVNGELRGPLDSSQRARGSGHGFRRFLGPTPPALSPGPHRPRTPTWKLKGHELAIFLRKKASLRPARLYGRRLLRITRVPGPTWSIEHRRFSRRLTPAIWASFQRPCPAHELHQGRVGIRQSSPWLVRRFSRSAAGLRLHRIHR